MEFIQSTPKPIQNITSAIQWYGEHTSNTCGYCPENCKPHSTSHGFVANKVMYADTYDDLLNCGWRRCGTYYYKHVMHKTCCPTYTIRLRAEDYKPSKDQKVVSRRLARYLETGSIRPGTNTDGSIGTINSTASTGSAPKHVFTTQTKFASFSDEKFELYKKYQVAVHQDKPEDLTVDGFTRFLIQSTLKPKPKSATNSLADATTNSLSKSGKRTFPYGTFHQEHRIDDVLVAVGVLDLIPSGVSSVYLFYDPDYRELVLGKVCAMKEIEFARNQGFEFYYLGFYIHKCIKMKYKAEYQPCELLCPTALVYKPYKECIAILDNNSLQFSPFEEEYVQEFAKVLATKKSNLKVNGGSNLSIFEPKHQLLNKTNNELMNIINKIPLELSANDSNVYTLKDLNKKGQIQVKAMLLEMCSLFGLVLDLSSIKLVLHN